MHGAQATPGGRAAVVNPDEKEPGSRRAPNSPKERANDQNCTLTGLLQALVLSLTQTW